MRHIYDRLALLGADRISPGTRLGDDNETQDDWSCATFWYEPVPSAAIPTIPDVKARTADIWPAEPPPAKKPTTRP
jgi:hypothetical protein